MFRILHPNEVFITEQVGGDNDRDLVEMVLPKTCKPFPHLNLEEQRQNFEDAGFEIVQAYSGKEALQCVLDPDHIFSCVEYIKN